MTDEKQWLSVTELSEQLGIPDATLRRYIRQHGHHLQLRKRHKSYLVADVSVDVLVQIREAYAAGKSIDDVEDVLAAAGAPTIITVNDVNDNGGRVTVNLAEALSDLQKTVNEQSDMIRALGHIVQQQNQAAAAASLPDPTEQRAERVTEHLTRRRIERRLEREALELWAAKPESERMRRTGLFRREEDAAARDRFVRDYVDDHYEKRLRQEFGLE